MRLTELQRLHPRLEWNDIIAAASIVLEESGAPPYLVNVEVVNTPGFSEQNLQLAIQPGRISTKRLAMRRRTFEHFRLVELAAIALAGLSVYHAGGHVIQGVAAFGSGADYVLDKEEALLEITGRSRGTDFESAWRRHWRRLVENESEGFYLFAVDFQSLKGRLAYQP
jgi:hypothetical protein